MKKFQPTSDKNILHETEIGPSVDLIHGDVGGRQSNNGSIETANSLNMPGIDELMNQIVQLIQHPLTDMTIVGQEREDGSMCIFQSIFGKFEYFKSDNKKNNAMMISYVEKIMRFLDGIQTDLSNIPIMMNGYTEFQKKVLQTAQKVKWSETISYQELAIKSGYSNASRAVGNVLRNNKHCLIIPCHRIIRKTGSVGGFGGANCGLTVELKKKLIANEKSLTITKDRRQLYYRSNKKYLII